ncbi:MAG: glycosyltransferase family 4 protein [Gammaproteobacteria bacterium]|nr:glycosyltransferase family 4 protein [Gammaproteobacteria bacterium]
MYTTLFPNNTETTKGIFVKQRVDRLAKFFNTIVVAPVRYIPVFKTCSKISRSEHGNIDVYHPRYFVLPKLAKWTDGVFLFLSTLFFIGKILKRHKVDLIDAHWGYPDGFAAYLTSIVYKIPFIVTLRGSDVNIFLQRGLRKQVILWYLRKLKYIVTVSNSLKTTLIHHGIDPKIITVIRNGVDLNSFIPMERSSARQKLGIDPDSKILLCVGNIVKIKGQDILVEAFANIRHKSAKLIFIGDGEMRNILENSIKNRLGATTRISFMGRKPHAEVGLWMNACDIYILPSRNEGMPNVVYEALACGIPVIATKVGDLHDIITSEQHGILVAPNDPTGLSRAIDQALATSWDKGFIRKHAEQFDWDKTISLCQSVYTTSIKNH